MGKYKKATKLVRSDLWAKAGGVDAVANELRENDVLNKNPGYSSEIWSSVSLALFGEDLKKNRCWLWMAWTKNHKGLRDRVHLGTKESNVMTSVVPENRTEGTESEDKETSSSKLSYIILLSYILTFIFEIVKLKFLLFINYLILKLKLVFPVSFFILQ